MRSMILVVLAFVLLAGCASDFKKGLCPTAAVLVPTSAVTIFRENAPADPSGELYSVWMTDVKTACDFDKRTKTTASSITLMFTAKRPPAGTEVNYRVPYFVTVTHGGGRIMTKKIYYTDVHFSAGESVVTFEQNVDGIDLTLDKSAKIGEYEILTGFQLTRAQLDYNTKNNHYTP